MKTSVTTLVAAALLCSIAGPAETPKTFRVSAVQDSQVWIEGGLLDGLQEGIEGEIYYEIVVLGQKKRIVPAKVRLSKIEDRQSIGALKQQKGIINVGYNASLVPRPPQDLLTSFHARGIEAFSSKDFLLAKQFYQRILEALPGDLFATQGIRNCDAALAKQAELARERRNVPYYKQVVRSYLDSKDRGQFAQANAYVEKILAVLPGDEEALRLQFQLQKLEASTNIVQQPDTKLPATKPVSAEAGSSPRAGNTRPAPEIRLAAKQQPGTVLTITENMMYVPGGAVTIGAAEDSTAFWNETPRHKIKVAPFYIDRYEVTNDDYKKFCDATGRTPPSYFVKGDYPVGWGRRPIVMISWIDADAYARWAGKRLPTEFEWEIAAAGTDGRMWPWGDKWDPTRANTREGGEKEPVEVGSYPADVSPFKVFDMAGNVSEWTADWYKPYPGNSHREKEYGEQFKVLRGGSVQVSKEFARAQFRARLPDGFRSMDLGFRCALSATNSGSDATRSSR